MIHLSFHPDVQRAQTERRAVVALESTVIAHGLPHPQNLEVAAALEMVVREGHAQPATIGVIGGVPTIGLNEAAIERFASGGDILKLSRRDIAVAIAGKRDGATTVAATMALAHAAAIDVFATGGIGGVHRGARESWDVSADLTELSRTPVLVVCAGAKSILDLPATLEVLETMGVPVVGFGTDEFPAFYSQSTGLRLTARADTADEVAAIWMAHLEIGGGSGMLVTVPPPVETAIPASEIEEYVARALEAANKAGIHGAKVTPFLLSAIKDETDGRSLIANIALLKNNARVAADIAVAVQRAKNEQ